MNNPIEGKSQKNQNSMSEQTNVILVPPLQTGIFGRLIERIKEAFNQPASENGIRPLGGRVQESDVRQADRVFDQFLAVAKKLEGNIEGDLVNHVQGALDLIMRDFKRIQKRAAQAPEENCEAFSSWIGKAKRWIELDAKVNDPVAIIDAIIKQHFNDLDELIDQDLRVIHDYEAHLLADLPISSEEKDAMEKVIYKQLTQHTQALAQLKEKPPLMELHSFSEWKENVDRHRNYHFDKALHAIDALVAKLSPLESKVEEINENLVAILSEVDFLQAATFKLMQDALKVSLTDDLGRKRLQTSCSELQLKIHLLNSNLHLTQDLFEHLQSIQNDLVEVESSIN
ncbi:MAG: hypothetical protein H0T62_09425 [Parachlamydiaceae bacterium]|nr:hypothetical protein [Parachlamydiaceae bacterium]